MTEMEQRAGKLVTRGMVVEGFAIYEGVLGMRVNTLGAVNKDTLAYARTFFLKANEWSMSLLKQNDIQSALTILLRCEQLLSSGWIRRFPSYEHLTSNNLACCFKKQNKLRTAQRYLEKALKVAQQFPDDVQSPSLTHLNLCVIHHQLKQPRSAMEHAQKSVVGFEREIEELREEINKLSSPQKNQSPSQREGDQSGNPKLLSESELNEFQNSNAERKEQKRSLLQKDLKEKETLLAIGCYNLAVQHQHQHNWAECFSFYEKAIEKCEKSLGAESKLVTDFKQAYDRARKHHSNRGGNYTPSKDITAGLSGVSYPQSRGKDAPTGGFQIQELRKSAIREITPKSKGKGPSSTLNDIDQEYWNYNSPERKKKIMMHYLTAVKISGNSPIRKNIKGTMDFKPRASSNIKSRGRQHYSEQNSAYNSRVLSEEPGTIHSINADGKPSDAWQSEEEEEFERLDRQGQYQWGRPQHDRDDNLQNVMIPTISTLPHRVGGGYDYRATSKGVKKYDPMRRSAYQKLFSPKRADQRSRSQGQLTQIYGRKNKSTTPERVRTKALLDKRPFPITSPTIDSNFSKESIVLLQRFIRGFLCRKRAIEKKVFYSGKYIPKGQDSNPLLLKIRLNKKEPENPLIDFLLYCPQTTPSKKSAKYQQVEISRLYKTFQISHPLNETPFCLCVSFGEFYNMGREFAARLTGDIMIDFKRIKLDDSHSIIEEYRSSDPASLKTVKEARASFEISPNLAQKKSKFVEKKVEIQPNPEIISEGSKVSSIPVTTVLYEGEVQLKLDQKTPVYANVTVDELNEETVMVRAKHKHTNNQIQVQGELLGKRISLDLRNKDNALKRRIVLHNIVEKMSIVRQDNQMNIEIGAEKNKEEEPQLAQPSVTSKRSSIKTSEKLKGKQVQDLVNRLYKKPESSLQDKRRSQPQTSSKLSSINVSKDTRNEAILKKNVALKGSRGSTPLPRRTDISQQSTDKEITKSQDQRQSRKLQKRGKLINEESFILTISYQRNEDESVKYEVDGYNQKRRHHYKLKEILLKKGETEKNTGECAEIIFEKVEFIKPKNLRPDSEGKLHFDSDLHLRGIKKTSKVIIAEEEDKIEKPELDVWDQEETAPPKQQDVFDEDSKRDESQQAQSIRAKSSRRSSYTSYKTQEKEPKSSIQGDSLQEASIQSKVKSLKTTSRGQKSERSNKAMQKNASQASITSKKSEQSEIKPPPKPPTPVIKEYTPRDDNLTVFEKDNNIKVYVTKPSPDFLLIGVREDIKFGERIATKDQVEDVIGEGLEDEQILLKEQLDTKLNPNVKVDYDLKLIAIQIPFPEQENSKEGYQEEGPERIMLIIDELPDNQREQLSKSGNHSSSKTDSHLEKIQSEKQKRNKTSKTAQLQLKTLRKERPPLVTKGAVKIGSRYYRYNAYMQYEAQQVEFDFYNLSDKEVDTVGKEVSVHDLHVLIKKKKLEEWMDLSYIIHIFMKKIASHGEWLDLPTIGDVIDSALEST